MPPEPPPPAPESAVSVVMPILDEEQHLADAVAAILAQDHPGEMEVILAVGPCTDRTPEVAASLAAADPRVRVVDNPSGRTPDGLNAAIAEARHDIVVRVDGHGILSPGYIAKAIALLHETGAANVGGIMQAHGETPFECAVAVAMTSRIGVGGARFHIGGQPGEADTVYLGGFRREWLRRVGGYNTHFSRAQDWEMNYRIRRAGGLIWFTPDLTVTYRPRASVRTLARQYRDYGRWRRVVSRLHTDSINLRYLAPPTALVLVASGTVGGFVWWPLWLLPAGYAVSVTVGGLLAARGEPLATRVRVPPVLAVMHGCWGWGFLTSPRRLKPETF